MSAVPPVYLATECAILSYQTRTALG